MKNKKHFFILILLLFISLFIFILFNYLIPRPILEDKCILKFQINKKAVFNTRFILKGKFSAFCLVFNESNKQLNFNEYCEKLNKKVKIRILINNQNKTIINTEVTNENMIFNSYYSKPSLVIQFPNKLSDSLNKNLEYCLEFKIITPLPEIKNQLELRIREFIIESPYKKLTK